MHALFRPLARTVRHRLLQPRTGAQRLPRLALQQVQPALDRGTARRQVGLGRPAHRQRRLDVLLGDGQGPQDLAVLGVSVGHAVPFAFRRSYTALVFLAATWTAFPPTSKPATAASPSSTGPPTPPVKASTTERTPGVRGRSRTNSPAPSANLHPARNGSHHRYFMRSPCQARPAAP